MEMGMPITDTEYYNLTMAKMPEVKQGQEYTVKKGDSLWAIAKRQLGNNAKRADILNYSYQIAKLNKFKNIKQMNLIRVNDKILLPETEKTQQTAPVASNNPQQTKTQTVQKAQTSKVSDTKPKTTPVTLQAAKDEISASPIVPWDSRWQYQSNWAFNQNPINPAQTSVKTPEKKTSTAPKVIRSSKPAKPVETQEKPKPKSNAQLGFEAIKNEIQNADLGNLHATRSEGYYSDIYYLTIRNNNRFSQRKEIQAAFTCDKEGNLQEISFDGQKDEMELHYDFTIHKNGTITQSDEYGIETKTVDKIDKKQFEDLEKILKQVIKNNKK